MVDTCVLCVDTLVEVKKKRHGHMVKVEDIKNECALMRTRMASRSLTRAYDEAMRPIGLKATQVTLLGVIKLGAPAKFVCQMAGESLEILFEPQDNR